MILYVIVLCVLHSYVCNIQREIRFIREVDDSFFVVCIKCDISGNPILPSRAILIGDIWRERKNRSCISCFICPPSVWGYSLPTRVHKHYKGRRVGPLMDLLFASRKGEYQRILSSRLAIASRFENQSPLSRDSCVSARIFAILLTDSSLQARRRHGWCCKDRCSSAIFGDLRMWRMNWRDTSCSPSV